MAPCGRCWIMHRKTLKQPFIDLISASHVSIPPPLHALPLFGGRTSPSVHVRDDEDVMEEGREGDTEGGGERERRE